MVNGGEIQTQLGKSSHQKGNKHKEKRISNPSQIEKLMDATRKRITFLSLNIRKIFFFISIDSKVTARPFLFLKIRLYFNDFFL